MVHCNNQLDTLIYSVDHSLILSHNGISAR